MIIYKENGVAIILKGDITLCSAIICSVIGSDVHICKCMDYYRSKNVANVFFLELNNQ